MARRKTKTVNGHRRRKRRGEPQFATVAAMEQAKATKCRAAYDALTMKPHQWKDLYRTFPDPATDILIGLIREMEQAIQAHTSR